MKPFTFPENVIAGDRIMIICYTSVESASLSFTWMKDGEPLRLDSTIRVKTQTDMSTLVLGPVAATHSGNYTCRATTPQSSSTYTARLDVYAPPTWVHKPADRKVIQGGNLTIPCEASGHPTPKITWVRISGAGKQPIGVLSDGSITFPHVQKSSQGAYACTASNGVGDPLNRTVTVTVTGKLIKIGRLFVHLALFCLQFCD